MRILITVPWGHRLGGSEEMLQTALDGARAAGHELELVFFEDGPWAHELRDRGFHVEVIAAGRLRQAHKLIATVLRLARVLRRRRPELIVNWQPKMHLYGAPAAMLVGMGDRLVWWQHGIPRRELVDRLATKLPVLAIGCSSSASVRAQVQLHPVRPTFVVAPGTRVPDLPQAMGDERQQVADSQANGVPGAHVSDTHLDSPPLQVPAGVPVVGLIGRLQPLKGQDRLLEAQALLRERGYEIHTLLVGGDAHGLSPEYADSLPATIGRLGLEDAVTMTGQVPDAGPYIEQLDVLINASDPPEAFGIVLLEAMARGVAVVAVDAGAPAEFIEDGRTGVLARSGEPDALADALERVLGAPELRGAIAAAGRERFMRDYTDAAMRERFYRQLERLVDTRGRADR
jgi:glycosyltransferase involved in cell wall biosynthesis